MPMQFNGTSGLTFPDASTQATTAYTGYRNRIINGDMRIAMRGNIFAATAFTTGAWPADRWQAVGVGTTAAATFSQGTSVPNSSFQYNAAVQITTADTSIVAGDAAWLQQGVEGFSAADLVGKDFTISFWVRSAKTGTHCVALRNSGSDRSYVATYTVNAANSWEYKTITVAGGLITAGTWDFGSGLGFYLRFALAVGSTYQTTAGAWQTGNFIGTSGQVNVLDTIGNVFAVTGVQIELGSTATPFEVRPIGAELALCQRYYQRDIMVAAGGGATPTSAGRVYTTSVNFPVQFRIAPTMAVLNTLENTNASAPTWSLLTTSRGKFAVTATTANDMTYSAQFEGNAEI